VTYNLTVNETHTYHVGEHDVLVHNDCDVRQLDRTGKVHGDVPNQVPPSATRHGEVLAKGMVKILDPDQGSG
jgi:hypothetical protein